MSHGVSDNVPTPCPGASMILAWRLAGLPVLVIGGGEVAERRVFAALEADAKVTVVAPYLARELQVRVNRGEVRHIPREFCESDLDFVNLDYYADYASPATESLNVNAEFPHVVLPDLPSPPQSHTRNEFVENSHHDEISTQKWVMVLSAIDDSKISKQIGEACRSRNIPVNVADVPELCDFYFMSTYRDKLLQVAVSTNGQGPRLARRLRREISAAVPTGAGQAIENVGILRKKIRQFDPSPESTEKRMKWMSKFCEFFSISELGSISETNMDQLLQNYKEDTMPEPGFTTINRNTASSDQLPKIGKLLLVGAGPGDPDLLTRKAIRALSTCDLVIADNLIPQEILNEIPRNVEVIVKPPVFGHAEEVQTDSNEWALAALLRGKTVVRLKSGDPFLFGRGGEELNYFREKGFETEAIPGISSALCAPLVANIPVTHRGAANQLLISTGRGEKGSFPDIPKFSDRRTLVLLMGVRESPKVAEELLKLGYPADFPLAIVERATMPGERVIRCTVATLPETVKKDHVQSPATFIVGNVVNACISNVIQGIADLK